MAEPKIRFKREDGTSYSDWETNPIGKYARIFDGVHQTPNYIESGVPFVSVEDIETLEKPTKFISVEDYKRDFKTKPHQGDILMTRIGDVGRTAIVPCNGYAYYVSLALIKPFEIVNNEFLCQAMKNDYFQKELWEHTIHTAFPKKINAGDIQHCKIALPFDIEEQQKIADFLSTVDEVISQSEAEVQNLEQQKKGAMQKIFSQEVRFKREDGTDFPEWEEKTFEETFTPLNNNTFSRDMLNNESGTVQNIHYGDILVKYGAICDVKKISLPFVNTDIATKKYDIMKNGDIIIADTAEDATVGKAIELIGIDNDIIISGLHTMACRPKQKYAPKFLGYLINSPAYHNQLFPYMQGIKVTSVGRKNIANTKLYYPCLEEQQKIADFLSAYDEAITCAKQELDKWKELKKGLLQQMFV